MIREALFEPYETRQTGLISGFPRQWLNRLERDCIPGGGSVVLGVRPQLTIKTSLRGPKYVGVPE